VQRLFLVVAVPDAFEDQLALRREDGVADAHPVELVADDLFLKTADRAAGSAIGAVTMRSPLTLGG